MKISAIILLLLMPMITVAQNYQNMSEEDMQKMMQQAQKMQSCMQNFLLWHWSPLWSYRP